MRTRNAINNSPRLHAWGGEPHCPPCLRDHNAGRRAEGRQPGARQYTLAEIATTSAIGADWAGSAELYLSREAREEGRARWSVQMDSLTTQQERLLEHELWLRGELRRLLDAISGEHEEVPAPEEIAQHVSDAVDSLGEPEAKEGEG